MKILIFGASGMLGHRLMIQLSKYHEAYETTREQSYLNFDFDKSHIIPMIHSCEAL